jgi:predicted dehydrogenase
MAKTISVALVGICGYGKNYIPHTLKLTNEGAVRFAGAIEPHPDGCPFLTELRAADVPLYESLEEFYKRAYADLVILATPINLHCAQTCLALSNRSNVLCEKPIAATIQDAEMIAAAGSGSKKFVAIGYQWSFTDTIQDLKRDIMCGLFGKAKRFKSLILWPRDDRYYKRNNWAGRQRGSDDSWILDSPINNAAAHYLHNMFYVLGSRIYSSAKPTSVVAELYRANDIENFDTAALRCQTDTGVEMLFYTSHAVAEYRGPVLCYEFENATVRYETNGYGEDNPVVTAHYNDGRVKNYGCPDNQPFKKLYDSVEAAKTGKPIVCGADAATSQTLCINGAQDSVEEIVDFPGSLVSIKSVSEGNVRCVEGLAKILSRCYEEYILPSEAGIAWAKKGRTVDLTNYHSYPM